MKAGVNSTDGISAEIAREITSGRMTPRELMRSSAYEEHVAAKLRSAVDKWESLPESDRQRFLAQCDEANWRTIEIVEGNEDKLLAKNKQNAPESRGSEDDTMEDVTYLRRS